MCLNCGTPYALKQARSFDKQTSLSALGAPSAASAAASSLLAASRAASNNNVSRVGGGSLSSLNSAAHGASAPPPLAVAAAPAAAAAPPPAELRGEESVPSLHLRVPARNALSHSAPPSPRVRVALDIDGGMFDRPRGRTTGLAATLD